MVMFILDYETEEIADYKYFPECAKFDECKEKTDYGIIRFYKKEERLEVLKKATKDFSRQVSVKELVDFHNSINKLRVEEGLPELTEEEYPTPTEGFITYFYADHAMTNIMKTYRNEGILMKKGISIWY